jgi:Co/Zn/Cd efflux system component/copper chaperone CopZ
MWKTTFSIPKMDCTAEEQLVRTALAGRDDVVNVVADLPSREVTVVHTGEAGAIASALVPLNLGARTIATNTASELDALQGPTAAEEARTLKLVLAINAGMFVAEALGAILAQSSALLADSLDMFADAAVYGLALFGVHRARASQVKAAHVSGALQLALAAMALAEVVRRLLFGSEPEVPLMIVVAAAALAANATSMWLLSRHRHGGAHMKASWIFTTTDVIANLGVIVAAVLVRLTASNIPDLVAAVLIALVVLNGAIRILRLR